ncbi:glycosyltransferase family 2 protein [Patescibacteria group bacterium]
MSGSRDAVAIVPAYNEEATVADVVRPLVASDRFREVVVVSDGSEDLTADAARAAGARVVEFDWNRGKGEALAAGVATTDASIVCFFDADLLGLEPRHAAELLDSVVSGRCRMCIGMMDRGPFLNWLAGRLPKVSGQRALPREVFMAVPSRHRSGFGIEVAMNHVCTTGGGRIATRTLQGVRPRRKTQKVGIVCGFFGYVRMWYRVAACFIAVRLEGQEVRRAKGQVSLS